MNKNILAATSVVLFLAGGASARAAAADAGPVVQNSNALEAMDKMPATTSIRQQIQDQLTKTGYTGITIMPSSFLIRAKDKQGNPVEMVVGPESFTEITEVKPGGEANAAPKTSAMSGAMTSSKTAPKQ